MCRWRIVAPISKIHMYKLISKMHHSCLANLHYEFNVGKDMGEIVARADILPKTRIGLWMLQDPHLWWKGADVEFLFWERIQGGLHCR